MTVHKANIKTSIQVLKLVSGEEIIAEVVENTQQFAMEYELYNPCIIVMQPQGLGLMPWVPYVQNDEESQTRVFDVQKMHVMVIQEPDAKFADHYYKNFGNGRVKASPILTPQKPRLQLVTPGNIG